ncbi:MAG TPA: ribonuclease HI family protein [Actinomycetota bacterium]|nr:ribonuclease HI family protein [Actinomycetota bacterium]
MSSYAEIVAHTDGGARGNPGPAGIGVHLASSSGKTIDEIAEAIGVATNNVAEYKAVIRALERSLELGAKRVTVRADSLLAVEQLRGVYKVKNAGLKPLHAAARALVAKFDSVTFEHVRREKNKKADALVNVAIDQWVDAYGDAPPIPEPDGPPTLFG